MLFLTEPARKDAEIAKSYGRLSAANAQHCEPRAPHRVNRYRSLREKSFSLTIRTDYGSTMLKADVDYMHQRPGDLRFLLREFVRVDVSASFFGRLAQFFECFLRRIIDRSAIAQENHPQIHSLVVRDPHAKYSKSSRDTLNALNLAASKLLILNGSVQSKESIYPISVGWVGLEVEKERISIPRIKSPGLLCETKLVSVAIVFS